MDSTLKNKIYELLKNSDSVYLDHLIEHLETNPLNFWPILLLTINELDYARGIVVEVINLFEEERS
jgi:hypothetical protein